MGGWYMQSKDPEGSNRIVFYILIATIILMTIYMLVNHARKKEYNSKNSSIKMSVDTLEKSK